MKKLFLFPIFFVCIFAIQILGQSWSGLIRLTWNTGYSSHPSVAVDSGGGIHVAYYDNTNPFEDVYYKRSTNGGTSWSPPTRLSWVSGYSGCPDLAADSGTGIHLVWFDNFTENNEIYYKRSTDSGASWSSLTRLTWNSGTSLFPAVAADSSGGIHVVWADNTPGNDEIYYKRSTNGGASWSPPLRLTWTYELSSGAAIAVDASDGIHVVWHDRSPGDYEIFYKHSTDRGVSWSAPTRLTWNPKPSWGPSIAADSGSGIHVVWTDDSPVYEFEVLYYKRSTDSGASWSGITRLTWQVRVPWYPCIAADSMGGVHVVWWGDADTNGDIYFKQSLDSGVTWSGITRLTWNPGRSEYPAIAAEPGGAVHIVWHDLSPGNAEIFYKNRK